VLSLLAFNMYVPASVMVAPMFAFVNNDKDVKFLKPYLQMITTCKVTMVVLAVFLRELSNTKAADAIVTFAIALSLFATTLYFVVLVNIQNSNYSAYTRPCTIPFINIIKISGYLFASWSAFVALLIATDVLPNGRGGGGDLTLAVFFGGLVVVWIGCMIWYYLLVKPNLPALYDDDQHVVCDVTLKPIKIDASVTAEDLEGCDGYILGFSDENGVDDAARSIIAIKKAKDFADDIEIVLMDASYSDVNMKRKDEDAVMKSAEEVAVRYQVNLFHLKDVDEAVAMLARKKKDRLNNTFCFGVAGNHNSATHTLISTRIVNAFGESRQKTMMINKLPQLIN
jgi:hypothetical protein